MTPARNRFQAASTIRRIRVEGWEQNRVAHAHSFNSASRIGFILGYGERAGISRRHRAQARRRYEMTGSSRLIGRRL
jgi:hypothetical protein